MEKKLIMSNIWSAQNVDTSSKSKPRYHFSGCEDARCFLPVIYSGGRNILISYYYLSGLYNQPYAEKFENIFQIFKKNSHLIDSAIVDNGIFTLCFGSKRNKDISKAIGIWYDRFIEFVKKNIPESWIIADIDCQPVCGSKEADEYRKRIRNDLKGYRFISTWHLCDKIEGFDKICDEIEGNIIGIPSVEIRRQFGKRMGTEIIKFLVQRMNGKPFHIMGDSSKEILSKCYPNMTCDSIGWLYGVMHNTSIDKEKERFLLLCDTEKLFRNKIFIEWETWISEYTDLKKWSDGMRKDNFKRMLSAKWYRQRVEEYINVRSKENV